jgi:hypothetical protein
MWDNEILWEIMTAQHDTLIMNETKRWTKSGGCRGVQGWVPTPFCRFWLCYRTCFNMIIDNELNEEVDCNPLVLQNLFRCIKILKTGGHMNYFEIILWSICGDSVLSNLYLFICRFNFLRCLLRYNLLLLNSDKPKHKDGWDCSTPLHNW